MSVRLLSGFRFTTAASDPSAGFAQPQHVQADRAPHVPSPAHAPSSLISTLKKVTTSIGQLSPPHDIKSPCNKYALWGGK